MRLLPKSFAGRLTALLLIALVIAQAVAFALFAHERREAFHRVFRDTVVTRTASVATLIGEVSPDLHDRVIASAQSRSSRFWLADEAAIASGDTSGPAADFSRDLAELLDLPADKVRAAVTHSLPSGSPPPYAQRLGTGEVEGGVRDRGYRRDRFRRNFHWLAISVALPGGRWLNAAAGRVPGGPPLGAPFMVSLILSAMAVGAVAIYAARRLSRPLRRLAEAADRLGRGETGAALAEEGPDEARRSIRAFNRMHQRLTRFVADRTAMLAAISHDLRTPITSLRLRAELVEDTEARDRILETLTEMQDMTEATLAFVREDAAADDTQTVDLAALVDSVVTDLAEIGCRAEFVDAKRCVYVCRPMAIRRALRNLVENAASHGGAAVVGLEDGGGDVRIHVDDDGPGLPDVELERMFEPFVRMDASRSRDTGGAGLGLAIARGIIRSHGGDVGLENRQGGGLRATIRLPRGDT